METDLVEDRVVHIEQGLIGGVKQSVVSSLALGKALGLPEEDYYPWVVNHIIKNPRNAYREDFEVVAPCINGMEVIMTVIAAWWATAGLRFERAPEVAEYLTEYLTED